MTVLVAAGVVAWSFVCVAFGCWLGRAASRKERGGYVDLTGCEATHPFEADILHCADKRHHEGLHIAPVGDGKAFAWGQPLPPRPTGPSHLVSVSDMRHLAGGADAA